MKPRLNIQLPLHQMAYLRRLVRELGVEATPGRRMRTLTPSQVIEAILDEHMARSGAPELGDRPPLPKSEKS